MGVGAGVGGGVGAIDTTILLVLEDFWRLRFLTVSRRYRTPDRRKVCLRTLPRPSGRNALTVRASQDPAPPVGARPEIA